MSTLLVIVLLSQVVSAAVVGNGTPSSCTESALTAAIPAGGVITFNCGGGNPTVIPFTFTLVVGSDNPPVTIDGNDVIAFDGTGITTGMIAIFGSPTALPHVTFKHLVIANGNITTGLNAGGAIQNFGSLTLDNVALRNNLSSGAGAIFQEPCTGCLTPALYATECVFSGNSTGGGAISIQGGIANIEQSTFTGNVASSAGAIEIYGNSTFQIDAGIYNCTFAGNVASFEGGAIAIELLNPGSAVRIVNDTFTGNRVASSGQGAAIYAAAGPLEITNCTIAGNDGGAAGGAVYFAANATAMNNTIIASNSGGNCSFAAGTTYTGGHNLQFGDSTCTGAPVANPLLGLLASNGGPTQTMALGAGSPAIDAADWTLAPDFDQRGAARADGDHDGKVVPDVGSFEAPGGTGDATPPRRRAVQHH